MCVSVNGSANKKLLAYIDRVIAHLNLDAYDAWIDIEIQSRCDGDVAGYAYGDEENVNIEIARNDAAGKIPMKDLMINIAHELVHALQIAAGRLDDQVFEGVDYSDVPYREQPWEIEAYDLEEKIYEICK